MLYNKLVKLLKAPNLYKLKNIHSAKKYTQHYVYEESLINNNKHSKIHNCTSCYYCNGTGWIVWKSNNSNTNNILDLNKQPNNILYTICSKCQKL
jgi:hypothetical protein